MVGFARLAAILAAKIVDDPAVRPPLGRERESREDTPR
jgi:hypothetical protein